MTKTKDDDADAAKTNFGRLTSWWPWLAAVISGLLYTACFPPFNVSWLCWICLTPLLAAIWFSGGNWRHRWLRDFLLGYIAGLVFFWATFSWLTTVTIPGWFLLQFYMALYFAIWSSIAGLFRPPLPPTGERETKPGDKWRSMLAVAAGQPAATAKVPVSPWLKSWNNLLLAFFLAATWVTMEWLRGWIFSGFGWNGLGVALHGNWLIIQVAEFTGVAGLTFVVAFTNVVAIATVCRFVLETRLRAMKPHWDINFTMLGIVSLFLYGWHVAKNPPGATFDLKVGAVQANIPRAEKFDRVFAEKIFERFSSLTHIAVQSIQPDLLVWPESAMPGPVLQDELSNRFVTGLAAGMDSDLLLGTIDVEGSSDYNAALLLSNRGQEMQLYRKLHLVPFGEYIPGRNTVPLLAQIIGDQVPGDFAFGTSYTVFQLTHPMAWAAPLICFEDTVGELTRRFVQPHDNDPGANLLVNVTNDGWFLHSAGSKQHLANAVFRCVETRRPLVRAANTGVTCFVNRLGRITQRLEGSNGDTFSEGVLCGNIEVPVDHNQTFYVQHGELFAHACVGLSVLGLAVASARRKIGV